MTMGDFPDNFNPAAVEHATASLAQGKYLISSLLFIQAFIRLVAKLQGTTHKCVKPVFISFFINLLVSNII